jgi:hypothetical protein
VSTRPAESTLVVGGCAALAVVSLLIPASITFDPWAWLVWGRETAHLALDTGGGPSWKPLPVVATTVLAPLGDAAPVAWLALTRFAGLLSVALVFRLARRFAGPWAGGLAVVAYVLSPDGGPRLLRLLLEGHSALVEATFALWAVESHLDGRRTRALWLLTGLALLRPEAWPFLGLYGLWLWRRGEAQASVAGAFALIPVLWFGADWWGSGSPLHGASSAQVAAGDSPLDRFGDAIERVVKVVVVPIWVGVGLALVVLRPRDRTLAALTGLALAWCGLVVFMATALGYAALSRFLVPAAALLCVVGAVGLVRGFRRLPAGSTRVLVAGLAVLVSVPLVLPRVLGVVDQFEEVEERARIEDELRSALGDADAHALARACDEIVADPTGLPRPVVAWELDLTLEDVRSRPSEGSRLAVVLKGGPEDRALQDDPDAVLRSSTGSWAVYTIGCGEPPLSD